MTTNNIPYGARLYVKNNSKVKKGTLICDWDPYNAVIIAENAGTHQFENIIDGVTYKEESDEQTGFKEKVIIETKDKKTIPSIKILDKKKEVIKSYNIPVGAHIVVNDNDQD